MRTALEMRLLLANPPSSPSVVFAAARAGRHRAHHLADFRTRSVLFAELEEARRAFPPPTWSLPDPSTSVRWCQHRATVRLPARSYHFQTASLKRRFLLLNIHASAIAMVSYVVMGYADRFRLVVTDTFGHPYVYFRPIQWRAEEPHSLPARAVLHDAASTGTTSPAKAAAAESLERCHPQDGNNTCDAPPDLSARGPTARGGAAHALLLVHFLTAFAAAAFIPSSALLFHPLHPATVCCRLFTVSVFARRLSAFSSQTSSCSRLVSSPTSCRTLPPPVRAPSSSTAESGTQTQNFAPNRLPAQAWSSPSPGRRSPTR